MTSIEKLYDALAKAKRAARSNAPAEAVGVLREAKSVLATCMAERPGSVSFLSMEATMICLHSSDLELAQDYAALLLTEVAEDLEWRGRCYQDLVKAKRYGDAFTEIHLAKNGAMVFLPYIESPLSALGQAVTNFLSRQKVEQDFPAIVAHWRTQLDLVGWAGWPYPDDIAAKARFWGAFAFTHLGNRWLETPSSGADIKFGMAFAETSLRLLQGLPRGQLYADSLSLLGRSLLYMDSEDWPRIIDCFERCSSILGDMGKKDQAAVEYQNLAATYIEQGSFLKERDQPEQAAAAYQRAKQRLLQAVAVHRECAEPSHLPAALINLGTVYSNLENWDQACQTYEAALTAAADAGDEGRRLEIAAANNLGQIFLDQRRPKEAIAPLLRAAKLAEGFGVDGVEAKHYLVAHGHLGQALSSLQRDEEAYPILSRALQCLENYRNSFVSERSNLGLTKGFRWVYEAMISCCAALGEAQPDRRIEAFNWAENVKWRMLTVILRYLPLRLQNMPPEEIRLEERNLIARVFALLAEPSQANRVPEAEQVSERLHRIWDELEPQYPDYARIRKEQGVTVKEAAALLDDEVPVLLEYYLGEEYGTAVAFVIHRDREVPDVVRLNTTTEELRSRLWELLPGDEPKSLDSFNEISNWFYGKIIEPALPFVPEGVGICVVPSGPLHNVPFAALYDGQRYLIQRNPLVVAPSATALRWWVCKNARRPSRCLIFTATIGGPDSLDLDGFERLARKEIAPLFTDPPPTIVSPTESTKQRLLNELAYQGPQKSWDVVHIACHGLFDKNNPLSSCLELAGDSADTSKNLTAYEILTSCRPDATLVTLSACESGTAQTSTGDEVTGLAPAFLFGGASTVLASLWCVQQDVGVAITRRFYSEWKSEVGGLRRSKIRAFQQALVETLEEDRWLWLGRKWPHPHLWATLQLTGDWR